MIWTFDTEDDSKGNMLLVDFYDGKKHYTFTSAEEAVSWLVEEVDEAEIWATNLGYDLSHLFYNIPGFIKISYAGSRVISARIPKSKIVFRDTLNHWKISVAEMGKRIGHEKLEAELFDDPTRKPTIEELTRRCQRDTEIPHRFVTAMKEKYSAIGMNLKATIGASALDHFYNTSFTKRPLENIFEKPELEFMKKAVYGGRTEVFFTKPIVSRDHLKLLKKRAKTDLEAKAELASYKDAFVTDGKVRCYDFNSMYPDALARNEFPVLDGWYWTEKPDWSKDGIAEVTVESPPNMHIPFLPCYAEGNLYFPTGTFRTFVTYPEIREALSLGYKLIKSHDAIEFPTRYRPFEKYIIGLYERRNIEKAKKDELASETFKLIMNNIFGKFGQGNEKTELIPLDFKKLAKHKCIILEDKFILRTIEENFPPHTNMIWSAYTTAYSRIKLWKKLMEAHERSEMLVACDTDSVFAVSVENLFGDSKELGELKLEGTFNACHFKGLKHYKLVTSKPLKKDDPPEGTAFYKVRGIPRKSAKEFFEKGRVEYRKPYRMREALKRNSSKAVKKSGKKIVPNYWDIVEKIDRKEYVKRKQTGSGKTRPLVFPFEIAKKKTKRKRAAARR